MSSRKMPQRYQYTVHEESGIPSPANKAKLDVVLETHCRADLVTEKTLILSGDFRFRF